MIHIFQTFIIQNVRHRDYDRFAARVQIGRKEIARDHREGPEVVGRSTELL